MKKNIAFLLLLVLAGCSSGPANKNENELQDKPAAVENPQQQTSATISVDGCYLQVIKRDTIAASLQQNGNSITGRMRFNNFEKDGSTGTVSGTLEGDILKLHYTFSSEGMQSVMELYFKCNDSLMLTGTGDMDTKGDTAYFVNPSGIKYSDGGLKKISCVLLPAKYK